MKLPQNTSQISNDAGFSVVELLGAILVVTIISTIALTSFQKASRSFNLSGATRSLSTYLEKARADSVRRHGGASLSLNSSSSYTVNIDFSGNNSTTARTISLPSGTSLSYALPPTTTSLDPSANPTTITYDWRGLTTQSLVLTLTNSTTGVSSSTVVVGRAGDLSTDTAATGPVTTPTPQNTTVTTSTGIKSMQ